MPSRNSSSLDLMVTLSWVLTLQICLIIALSFRWQTLEVWLYQWPSLTGTEQELYMQLYVLKERWHKERTGSSSLNFFKVVFTLLWLKVHSHQLLRACLLGRRRKPSPPTCQVRLGPPSLVCHPRGCSSLASCTSVIRVLCQALEPTAFFVHPVLAAVAEDAVATHSRATDGAWKLS